ncbi:MAG: YhcH/YjgK/YiaL family protein [Tannerellaceae bacterium]
MIHDSLNNSQRVEALHPLFKKAFDYIRATDLSKQPDGRIELDGDRLTISLSTIIGKPEQEARIETHKRYIDIQLPLSGSETIGWKAGNELEECSVPYDTANDIAFYADRPTSYTHIRPGQFVIYFPEDGHAPCIAEGSLRKVVIKVAV